MLYAMKEIYTFSLLVVLFVFDSSVPLPKVNDVLRLNLDIFYC